jgi:predicted 2-oxoglutarate/Fe(II)-dependent dioxygenase YbiX
LIAEMRQSNATLGVTYGKGEAVIDQRVRRVSRFTVTAESNSHIAYQLENQRPAIADYFRIKLTSFEEPQFLCYRVGDFFVAHQDGNTGMVQLETDRTRRISVSIFLNDQSIEPEPDAFCGGSLVFHDWRHGTRQEIRGEAGMLCAFRSELTHEVTPVTCGERYVIVTWYGIREV